MDKKKSAKKTHKKGKTAPEKNVSVKNDLTEGMKQLPPKEVESSSCYVDSPDSEEKVTVQTSAAALTKPAAHASKNADCYIMAKKDSGESDKEPPQKKLNPKANASSSEATQPNTFIVAKPNTIIVGNLSRSVDISELRNFFQGVGKIVDISLATFDDGTCRGSAQVEFATFQAVNEACKLSGSNLMGRAVTLNFGHKQLTISPNISYFKKPADFSANTILIRGFDAAYGLSKIHESLCEHFDLCGDITRTKIMDDYETGASIGYAFMEFRDQLSVWNALKLNGTNIGVFCLHVEEASNW